jgi:predicted ribosomally synthesized peptide with nif11-like leader
MSKQQVLDFFQEAGRDESLGREVRSTSDPQQLLEIAETKGFHFSRHELDEALRELHEHPNFFQKLANAVIDVFRPNPEEPPSIGVQPFEGDIKR